jgi:glycosyltransferase involved in cell wall biosynthesis
MNLAFVLPPIEPYSPRGLALSTIVWHTSAELSALGHSVSVISPDDPAGLYDIPRVVSLPVNARETLLTRARHRVGRTKEWDWPSQDRWHRDVVAALEATVPELDAMVVMNDLQVHGAVKRSLPKVFRATWLQNEIRTAASQPESVFAAAQRFLCCSEFIAASVRAVVGPDAGISVVNNCVDTSMFSPLVSEPRADQSLRVLFVGRLDLNKGPDALVGAVREAAAAGAKVELTVAGPTISYSMVGPEYDRWLETLLAGVMQVGGRYVGRVERPDLPHLYREHDVTFVLSRSDEPFGMVALEAMACGNLVVASDRGGLREATGGHAVYVNPDDVAGIAEILVRLAKDPTPFESQRHAGAAWAATRGWHNAAAALLDALSFAV